MKTLTAKVCFEENQFDNIFRLFDVFPNFNFTTSGPMGGYYI